MDITITTKNTESNIRKSILLYYSLHCRASRFYRFDVALAALIAFYLDPSFIAGILWGFLAVFYIWGLHWWGFLLTWRRYRSLFIINKTFESTTTYHITDEYIEISRGENRSKQLFADSVTAFYYRENTIVLYCGELLFAVFTRDSFSRTDEFDELVAHFRNGHYEDRTKFPIRKALIPWGIGVALIIWGILF